jgi:hypothetical protein
MQFLRHFTATLSSAPVLKCTVAGVVVIAMLINIATTFSLGGSLANLYFIFFIFYKFFSENYISSQENLKQC